MKTRFTIFLLLLALGLPRAAGAQDFELQDLPAEASPAPTDLLYVVTDPAGTPASKKATISDTVAGALSTLTFPFERWYDVAGCQNTTPLAVLDQPTSNPPTPFCDTGSNTQKGVLRYSGTTDQATQFKFRMRSGATGQIDIIFRWKVNATSGNAGWCLQLVRVAAGSTSNPAFPAQAAGNCASGAAVGTPLAEIETTKTSVTCTSCAPGDMIYARLSRDADGSAVTDTLGDADLLGFALFQWGTLQ